MLDQGAPSGFRFFPVNSRVSWLLCDVHVHFDCAGSHKLCCASFPWSWSAAFYLIIIAFKIPLAISTTKSVNTCWAPSPILDINWLPKMKSCLRCCSQRSCAASCSGFSLFELSSENSELHFVVIYVGMLWVIQKTSKNRVVCFAGHAESQQLPQTIFGSWLTIIL